MSGYLDKAQDAASGAYESVASDVKAAALKVNIAAEKVAISGAFFGTLNDEQVGYIQGELRSWGIEPSPSNTMLEAMLIPMILLAVIGITFRLAFGYFSRHIINGFFVGMIVLGIMFFYYDKALLLSLLRNTYWTGIILSSFSLLWSIFFLGLYKNFPWMHDPTNDKMSITYAIFVDSTILRYKFFMGLFGIEKDRHHKDAKIGPTSMWIIGLGWIGLLFTTMVGITWQFHPELESFISKIKEGFAAKAPAPAPEPFLDVSSTAEAAPNADTVTLTNIQPVSIKQIGYVGPTERGGKFETDIGIINAIQAGVRFFTLQIDYLDTSPGPGFDPINTPTLVYRNDSKAIISTNGASIADVAKKLSIYAFNKDFPTNTQPLVLYLHFVRTPNYISKPDKYMKFLSAVATALAPLKSNILSKTDTTDFSRQSNERILINTPVTAFENKALIFTNADTTIFRNAEKLGMTPVSVDQDLDYMTCMRVYLDDESDSLGITTSIADGVAHAVVVSYKRLNALSAEKKNQFAAKGKSRFVIAMSGQTERTDQNMINALMKAAGVNTVPMNLFGKSDPEIKSQLTTWGGQFFTKMKPVTVRSTKVAVAGYTPPPNLI